MSEFATRLASEQRARLVSSILSHAEREVYPHLAQPQRKAFREKVLASVGVYHDFVLDCLRATTDDTSVVNEEAMRLLQSIHSAVREPRAS